MDALSLLRVELVTELVAMTGLTTVETADGVGELATAAAGGVAVLAELPENALNSGGTQKYKPTSNNNASTADFGALARRSLRNRS